MDSRYFTVEEFACRSGEAYPSQWEADRLVELVGMLDVIREAWAGPVVVVSGYRSPEFNAALVEASRKRNGGVSGVATHSQHIEGRAADIQPAYPTVERAGRLHGLILRLYGEGKLPALGGLGKYRLWSHVDCRRRPTGDLALCTGDGLGSGQ